MVERLQPLDGHMMIRFLLAAFLSLRVLAAGCGGGGLSTAMAPAGSASVEQSTVASPPTSERTPTIQSSQLPRRALRQLPRPTMPKRRLTFKLVPLFWGIDVYKRQLLNSTKPSD